MWGVGERGREGERDRGCGGEGETRQDLVDKVENIDNADT